MNRLAALLAIAVASLEGPEIVYPAGRYEVVTTGPTRITSGETWVKIEWDAGQVVPVKPPNPVKPTDPPPPPPPGPTTDIPTLTGPVWIAAVYDKTTAGSLPQGQQSLLLSKTISDQLKPLNITWSSWDKTDQGLKDWMTDAGTTYPTLLVIWAGGAKSKTFPLPTDDQAMLTFAKKLRGQ